MSDFDHGNTQRPQNEETFQPGVTITEDGVSLFMSDFRAQELRDGVLMDVSDAGHEIGFVYPVAMTRALWEDIQAIPESYSHEDVKGRLWDVLSMAMRAVKESDRGGTEVRFNLVLHVGDTSLYPVKLICEPGDDFEPVITLSNPDKDIDLELGEVVLTEGGLDALVSARVSPAPYLLRHRRGDWGELDIDDKATNDRAAREGQRVLSVYTLAPTQQPIWIVTEWDRSHTTIGVPDEFRSGTAPD